ncbi:MAG: hypothetical protein GF344_15930 [Chitinivibrionales bacterium]|nr:hypothetical protein [Chitinivibrionales bacterium]MBD3358187.1 hypothetical protein [Chitinivibrionales bacterium]
MRHAAFGVLCVWLFLSAGCWQSPLEHDEDASTEQYTEADIPNQTLQGKVGGRNWLFKSGKVCGDTAFNVELYNFERSDPCNLEGSDFDYIFFEVPNEEGTYHLSFRDGNKQGVYFYDGDSFASMRNTDMATEGILIIDSITTSHVYLRINASAGEDDYAAGKCGVRICP